MAGKWEAERRLDYIDFRMVTAGNVRRADIMRTFGVSMPQASADINEFIRRNPGAIMYDKSRKWYAPSPGYATARGNTPDVVALVRSLHAARHPMGWE